MKAPPSSSRLSDLSGGWIDSRAAAVNLGQSRVLRRGAPHPHVLRCLDACPPPQLLRGRAQGPPWSGVRSSRREPFRKRSPQALIVSQPHLSRLLTAEAGSVLTRGPRGPVRGPGLCPGRNSTGGWSAEQILHTVGLKAKHISISASDRVLQTNQY